MARRSHAVALFRRQYRSPETEGKKETAAPNTHHSLIDWMITMIMIMMKAAELLRAGSAGRQAEGEEGKAGRARGGGDSGRSSHGRAHVP